MLHFPEEEGCLSRLIRNSKRVLCSICKKAAVNQDLSEAAEESMFHFTEGGYLSIVIDSSEAADESMLVPFAERRALSIYGDRHDLTSHAYDLVIVKSPTETPPEKWLPQPSRRLLTMAVRLLTFLHR